MAASISYIGIANVVAFCAGIVRQKVFAIFLSPSGLGAFALASSFFELFTAVGRVETPIGLLTEFRRSLSDGNMRRAARVFLDVRKVVIIIAVVLGLAVTILSQIITVQFFGSSLPWWTVPALAVAAPLLLQAQLCGAVITALGQIRALGLCNLATVLVGLPLAVWLVAAYGLPGAILQIVTGAIVAFLIGGGILRRLFRASEHNPQAIPAAEARRAVTSVIKVGAIQGLHYFIAALNYFAVRSIVTASLGIYANGLFHATNALSRQYTAALSAGIFVGLYPRLVELVREPRLFSREVSKAAGFALAVAVPIVVMLITNRDLIVRIIFTVDFLPILPLMTYSLCGDVVALMVEILRMALLASGSPRIYLVAAVLTESFYISVFLVGIRLFGLTGAVAAYPLAGIAGLSLYALALSRRGTLFLPMHLILQFAGGVTVCALLTLPSPGIWSTRILGLVIAVGWLLAWRRELHLAFRS